MAIEDNIQTLQDQSTLIANSNDLGTWGDYDITDDVRPQYPYVMVGVYYLDAFGRLYGRACINKNVYGSSGYDDDEAYYTGMWARRVICELAEKIYAAFFPTEEDEYYDDNVWLDATWPFSSEDRFQNLLEAGLKALKYLVGPAYSNTATYESAILEPIIPTLYTMIANNFTTTAAANRLEDGTTTSDTALIEWAKESFAPVGTYDWYRYPKVIETPSSGMKTYLKYVVETYESLSGNTVYRNQLVREDSTIYVVTSTHTASGETPDDTVARDLFDTSS